MSGKSRKHPYSNNSVATDKVVGYVRISVANKPAPDVYPALCTARVSL